MARKPITIYLMDDTVVTFPDVKSTREPPPRKSSAGGMELYFAPEGVYVYDEYGHWGFMTQEGIKSVFAQMAESINPAKGD